MTTISYTEVREQLASVWDRSVATREPIIISRRGAESVVMLPLDEWEGMQETAHLLRFEAGEGERMTTEELASRIGTE